AADAAMYRAVLARRHRHRLHVLYVIGEDETGDGAMLERNAHRAIHQVAYLCGRAGHMDVLGSDVLKEADEVHLLLVIAAEAGALLLADDGEHRLVVHLRVVETIQEMDRARTGGGEADADFAGELGMRARHEGGELLVARLDELHLFIAPERTHDAVDAIAGIAVDALHAPLGKALQ